MTLEYELRTAIRNVRKYKKNSAPIVILLHPEMEIELYAERPPRLGPVFLDGKRQPFDGCEVLVTRDLDRTWQVFSIDQTVYGAALDASPTRPGG